MEYDVGVRWWGGGDGEGVGWGGGDNEGVGWR